MGKIGDWTEAYLMKFITTRLQSDPSALPPSLALESLSTSRKLTVKGDLELSPQAIAYLKNKLGL